MRALVSVSMGILASLTGVGCAFPESGDGVVEVSAEVNAGSAIPAVDRNGLMNTWEPQWFDFAKTFKNEKVVVIQSPSGHILSRAKSKSLLEKQITGFVSFRQLHEPAFVLSQAVKSSLMTASISDSWFEANIEELIPERFLHLLFKRMQDTVDANCWNTALVGAGLENGLLHSSGQDFDYLMSSPQCRPLAPEEKSKTGDVVAIRDRKGNTAATSLSSYDELHAAVVISDELWLSKNNPGSPFTFISSETVTRLYMEGEARQCTDHNLSPEKRLGCAKYLRYFRCDSNLKHRKSLPVGSLDSETQDLLNRIEPMMVEKERESAFSRVIDDGELQESYGSKERFIWFETLKSSLSLQQQESASNYAATRRFLPVRQARYEYPAYPATVRRDMEEQFGREILSEGLESAVNKIQQAGGRYPRNLIHGFMRTAGADVVQHLTRTFREVEQVRQRGDQEKLKLLKGRLHTLYSLFFRLTSYSNFDSVVELSDLPTSMNPLESRDIFKSLQ